MKKKTAFLTVTLLIFNLMLYSQDYIVTAKPVVSPQQSTFTSIKNDTLTYIGTADNQRYETTLDDLFGIRFQSENSNQLLFLSYQFETIRGDVETITKRNILYRDANNLLNSIDINDAFCIYFDESGSEKIGDSLYANFKNIRKSSYENHAKLIKSDSTIVNILKDITLHQDTIHIKLKNTEKKTFDTYANINTLIAYINKEPADRMFQESFSSYVQNKKGEYYKVSDLKVEKNTIAYARPDLENDLRENRDKNSIIGIFFNNYDQKEPEVKEPEVKKPKKIREVKENPYHVENAKYTVDFGLGYGNMLATDNSFNFLNVDEEYKTGLKRGVSMDMNIRAMVSKEYGIGLKYNHFYTYEKFYETLSEKINIKFLGVTLFGKIPISNNRWLFNIDLSIGFATRSEHFVLNKKQYYISGTTPAIYTSPGLEYFFYRNISAGVYFGFMGGYLESPSINTDYEHNNVLGKSHSLGRMDALIRIKAYL